MVQYTVGSRWDSKPAFTADQTYDRLIALGANEPSSGFLRDVIDTFYDIGPAVNLNPDLMSGHCANETGDPDTGVPMRSAIYLGRGVIDGLGVTDGGDQGLAFASGREAALAHMVHLYAYVHGAIPKSSPLAKYTYLDPRYSLVIGGGNAGTVRTVKEMTGKWWTDPNGHNAVIQKALAIFGSFTLPHEGGQPVGTIVFGRVPKPEMVVKIVKKAGPGHGYYEVAPRQPVGACRHGTDGTKPSGYADYGDFLAEFFGIGGERADDALTDYVVSRSGRITMLNDPWGTRSPWANGNTEGLQGDGIAFVNTLGVGAVNSRLVSVEHEEGGGAPMTDAQLEASCQLYAWLFDQMKVPYSSYPVNPNVGLRVDIEHWEFTDKGGNGIEECPGSGIRAQVNQHQARVKALLKEAQVVTVAEPTEPEVPVEPTHPTTPVAIYPPGMTLQLAKRLYGTLKVTWAKQPFTFDMERSECRFWLNTIKKQLKPGEHYTAVKWPKLSDVIRRGDGSRVYTWSDGTTYEQAAREI